MTLTYIIEVRFEFDGAEDWQSVAERVRLAQDLVVERYFACTEPRRQRRSNHKKRKPLMRRCWGETGALVTMQGPPLTVFWKKKKEAWAGNMSFMNSCFPHTASHSELLTASLKRRRRPLTCFHRFNVLQDDLHPTVEHLYGAVLGDEVLSNWWQRQGKAVFCELKLKEFIFY